MGERDVDGADGDDVPVPQVPQRFQGLDQSFPGRRQAVTPGRSWGIVLSRNQVIVLSQD